jgi:hypothetical protein
LTTLLFLPSLFNFISSSAARGKIVMHPFISQGVCTSSMVVAVIAQKLQLTCAERHVYVFMMDAQLTKRVSICRNF